ncbi:MAG TPA: tripartite tricarboxylate transporter substrate binding protein [Burkholderiales bacterium]|nr:tripartite tricarboxylate transporter substrate binding protein [Burkholderiales bacterium]
MKLRRILLLGALLCVPVFAAAQSFPVKPVRMVIPYPPGQGADIFGRMIGDELSRKWGQPVVADNRAGGGGMPGILSMRSAPPDGYTLVVGGSQAITVNPNVYAKMPYDPQRDLQPISGLYIAPLVWVVHPSSGLNTLADLVNEARRDPGKLNYASAGVATSQHMTAELFCHMAGINMQHVAYKGSGPAMTDLLGGQVKIMMDGVASALPHINSGKLKALAVTTAERTPQLPNVPTIAESGYPGFLGVGWAGLFMPAGGSKDVAEKISADVRAVLNEPEMKQRIVDRGGIPDPMTPEQTAAFVKTDTARWGQVAKTANIKID